LQPVLLAFAVFVVFVVLAALAAFFATFDHLLFRKLNIAYQHFLEIITVNA